MTLAFLGYSRRFTVRVSLLGLAAALLDNTTTGADPSAALSRSASTTAELSSSRLLAGTDDTTEADQNASAVGPMDVDWTDMEPKLAHVGSQAFVSRALRRVVPGALL